MYIWHQTRGALTRDGELIALGYSGRGVGLNRPEAQALFQAGPIPQGKYTIEPACDSTTLGPCALPLKPDPTNMMYGRLGFYIHGDNQSMNHSASEGCIILAHDVRTRIIASGDFDLTVTA